MMKSIVYGLLGFMAFQSINVGTVSAQTARKKGLIIVDVQIDFIDPWRDQNKIPEYLKTQGLSVFGDKPNEKNGYLNLTAKEYGNNLADYMEQTKDKWDFVVYSLDFHPKDHCSFANENAGYKKYDVVDGDGKEEQSGQKHCFVENDDAHGNGKQMLWTPHCVQNSDGFKILSEVPRYVGGEEYITYGLHDTGIPEYHETFYSFSQVVPHDFPATAGIRSVIDCFEDGNQQQTIQLENYNVPIFYTLKGTNPNVDSYSAFEGNKINPPTPTGLESALHHFGFTPETTDLTILGVAYDVCVKWTAIHASQNHYRVHFVPNLSAAVFETGPDETQQAFDKSQGCVAVRGVKQRPQEEVDIARAMRISRKGMRMAPQLPEHLPLHGAPFQPFQQFQPIGQPPQGDEPGSPGARYRARGDELPPPHFSSGTPGSPGSPDHYYQGHVHGQVAPGYGYGNPYAEREPQADAGRYDSLGAGPAGQGHRFAHEYVPDYPVPEAHTGQGTERFAGAGQGPEQSRPGYPYVSAPLPRRERSASSPELGEQEQQERYAGLGRSRYASSADELRATPGLGRSRAHTRITQ